MNKIPVSFRIDPVVKALALKRAEAEHRSLASYIEWLVIRDARNGNGASEGSVRS